MPDLKTNQYRSLSKGLVCDCCEEEEMLEEAEAKIYAIKCEVLMKKFADVILATPGCTEKGKHKITIEYEISL